MISGHRAGDDHHADVNGAASDLRVGLAFATLAARGDDHAIVGIVAHAPRTASARAGRGPTGCRRSYLSTGLSNTRCTGRAAPSRHQGTTDQRGASLNRRSCSVAESRSNSCERGSPVSASRYTDSVRKTPSLSNNAGLDHRAR